MMSALSDSLILKVTFQPMCVSPCGSGQIHIVGRCWRGAAPWTRQLYRLSEIP